jgi:tetratricopeptide (TPR) repeat protein
LILAGQKSARDYINLQAREYFEQAQQVLPQVDHGPSQAFDVYLGLGDVMVFSGEYEKARSNYWKARDFVDGDDIKSVVTLRRNIGKTYLRQGDYDQALEYLSQAQDVLDCCSGEFPVERAEVWNDIAWINFRRGDFNEAGEIFRKALDLVVDSSAYGVIASIYNRLGGVAYFQGEWDQAAEYLRKSITIRETIGDLAGLASSSNNLGNLEIEMGLFDDALEDMQRNLELVKRLGQVDNIAVAHNNLGWLYTLRGETEKAKNSLDLAFELAYQIGFSLLIREVRKNIGELHLALEQWNEAQDILLDVVPAFEDLVANDQLLVIYRLLGEAAIGAGDLTQAESWAQKVDQITENFVKEKKELPALQRGEILRFRGMLAIQKQDWEQANLDLQRSLDIFRKLRSRLYAGRSMYQLGRLEAARGQNTSAVGYFQDAIQIFGEIGAQLDAKRTRLALEKTN